MKYVIVEKGKRLDSLLAQGFPKYSRNYFQSLINAGSVTCNGKKIAKKFVPSLGDEIQILFSTPLNLELKGENIPLEILYEDEALICINKLPHMVVHPAPGHLTGTCVNALLYHYPSLPPQDVRPGIVHRLDKDTSGVLLVAKTIEAREKFIQAFSQRKITKEYLAIALGNPGQQIVNKPIARHPIRRKEMAILEKGRHAITIIDTLRSSQGFSLIKAIPITGRTHQIRLHLKHLKTPIVGDPIYGVKRLKKKLKLKRHFLHAHRLRFTHPVHGKTIVVEAPLPKDFTLFLKNID